MTLLGPTPEGARFIANETSPSLWRHFSERVFKIELAGRLRRSVSWGVKVHFVSRTRPIPQVDSNLSRRVLHAMGAESKRMVGIFHV